MCNLIGDGGPNLTGPEMVALLPDKKQFEKKCFAQKMKLMVFLEIANGLNIPD
jgi:hypothetical protein